MPPYDCSQGGLIVGTEIAFQKLPVGEGGFPAGCHGCSQAVDQTSSLLRHGPDLRMDVAMPLYHYYRLERIPSIRLGGVR
jgi:hypothetical protein